MPLTSTSTGSKKRLHKRGYRSYRVKYGVNAAEHQAYARRLSERGLFIATNLVVYPVGAKLTMDIDISGTIYHAEGIVRNSLKIDSRYARLSKPGMGVEFIEPPIEMTQAIISGG